MLLINNQEVERLFAMKDCLEALEDGDDDLLKGDAVSARLPGRPTPDAIGSVLR